jgi:hypothetical protein
MTTRKKHKNNYKKSNKCFIYKSCEHVPCNSTMNKCKPSYCVPGSSRNWSLCNMANWGLLYEKYRHNCRDESKCIIKNTKKTKHTVDANTLHNKMPYIWRFLKPKTRKLMIDLAKKPVSIINIPGHIFPDLKKHQTINSVFKNMTKKNRKRFYKLRKKYKDI